MGTGHHRYTDDFKRGALGLLPSSSRPLRQIAGELGIPAARLRRENERLRMERGIQKNTAHLLGTTEMKFRFVETQRKMFPVRVLCDVLGFSAAAYCAPGKEISGHPLDQGGRQIS
jgi:hypothetical protein